MSFFVSYIENRPLMFYFVLKILIAFIQFIKSLLGLYIQKTVISESTKLIVSEMFHFSMGFTIFFFSIVKNIQINYKQMTNKDS